MTWNQELTQLEYQTSHSRIDKCLWKPIRKMLNHLAFPFPGKFLLLFPASPADLNATPWEHVCGEAEEGFWRDFHSLCSLKEMFALQSTVSEIAFRKFPSKSTFSIQTGPVLDSSNYQWAWYSMNPISFSTLWNTLHPEVPQGHQAHVHLGPLLLEQAHPVTPYL